MSKAKKESSNEETPQYRHQVKLATEKKEIEDRYKVKEEYYIQNGNKVLKCFRKENGNVVRMFAFMATQHPKALKEIKQNGDFRTE